jgi:hypothetical protein
MKPIEFASPSDATTTNDTSPWTQPKRSVYQDLILKEEYEERRLKLPIGQTWLRLVPAFQSSPFDWMLAVHAVNFDGGKFAHPKTLRRNARSIFDHAYSWCLANAPESLFSKTNKNGVRLLTDPLSIFWCFLEEEGRTVARLFLASGYDGSRGGVAGLGYQLWKMAHEKDETGTLICDAVNHESGVLVCIEKTQPRGAKYPSYSLRRGRQPAPIADFLSKMDDTEIKALCPLEDVVRELSEEEQWKCLEKVIAPKTVAIIRENLKR